MFEIVAVNNEEFRKVLKKIHNIEGVGSTDSFISSGSALSENISLLLCFKTDFQLLQIKILVS
jgi:hypothetical protein